MIRVQPFLLPFAQQADVGQLLAHGRHGDVFEAQVRFVAELKLRLDFLDCYDVCDARVSTLSAQGTLSGEAVKEACQGSGGKTHFRSLCRIRHLRNIQARWK